MTNLFFMLCWWIGVFTQQEAPVPLVLTGTMEYVPNQPMVARFDYAGFFILYDEKGREIVSVNTRTGKAELRGNPNAAAKRFWKAVELMAEQAGGRQR